jgi:hypothetical protein
MNILKIVTWLKRGWRIAAAIVLLIGLFPNGATRAQTTTTTDPAVDYMVWPDDELFVAVPYSAYDKVELISGTTDSNLTNFKVDSEITSSWYPEWAAASGHMLDTRKETVALATAKQNSLWADFLQPMTSSENGFLKYNDMFPAMSGCSSFMDIATGNLDDSRDANDNYHDEAVLVYAVNSADGALPVKIAVMDFTDSTDAAPAPGAVTTALGSQKIYSSDLYHCVDNALGVATGDFDGDGIGEIAVGYQVGSDWLQVDVFRYTTIVNSNGQKTHSLSLWQSSRTDSLGWLYVSLDIAADDFDGDGRDEVAITTGQRDVFSGDYVDIVMFGFSAPSGLIHIAAQVEFSNDDPFGYYPIRVQAASGLFGRPESMDDPADPNLSARQLALAYTCGRYPYYSQELVCLKLVAFSDPDANDESTTAPSGTTYYFDGYDQRYFFLAAGGFRGLRTSSDYDWSLALGSWGETDESYSYRLSFFHPTASFELAQVPYGDYSWSAPAFTTPKRFPVIATDVDGDSVYLGAPMKLVMEDVYEYKMILQEPPKHAYWDKEQNKVVTISRWDDFYVELKESAEYDYMSSTKHETDSTYGLDAEAQASISKKFGKPLRRKEVDAKIDGTFKYDYDDHYENYNSVNETYSYEFSRDTSGDDVVSAEVTYYEIWRYPAYGMEEPDANGNTMLAYMDIIMPSSLPDQTTTRAAATFEDWQPVWENGNILSYPIYESATACRTPVDLGSFSIPCKEGDEGCVKVSDKPEVWKKEIHDVMAYGLLGSDAAGGTDEITMTKTEGSGEEQTYSNSLNWNADLHGYIGGKVFEGTKLAAEVGIGYNGSYSWSDTNTTENTTTTTRSLYLTSPARTESTKSYVYAPVLYITQDGAMKLSYCVDLPGSGLGKDTWLGLYGDVYGKPGKPDPALNLPYRFTPTYSDLMTQNGWEPQTEDVFRYQIRGFFIKEPEQDPNVNDYLLLTHDPIAGETVRLEVRVNNYTLSASNGNITNLKVKFYATAIDPVSGKEIVQEIDTTTIPNLPSRQPQVAAINWTPMSLGAPGLSNLWRVYIQLDPDNVIDEIYDSDDPATYCPHETCTAEEYIDPGQNNLGFREVSVVNPTATSDLRQYLLKDVSLGRKSMLALNRNGKLDSGTTQVYLGSHVPIRVHVTSDKPAIFGSMVRLYEGDPNYGGKLLAEHRILPGIPGSTGNSAWFLYTPMTKGPHYLYAVVVESSDDVRTGNNIAQLKVVVIPPPKGAHK